jgi:hypothetical protein
VSVSVLPEDPAPLAALFSVKGVVLPAWVWNDGQAWAVGLGAVLHAGSLSVFGGQGAGSRVLDNEIPWISISPFGQAGACLEFLRILSGLVRPGSVGWREAMAPTGSVVALCSQARASAKAAS